ncbi:uncharacterized protein TNCV_1006451 [Trichonephila clavipes]|nr:uncharacterized protein TNCV_1006451 [Trichonephila clavipes]
MTGGEKLKVYKHMTRKRAYVSQMGDTTIHIQSWRASEKGHVELLEDFGKRNIPGKLAGRHFSQLSEKRERSDHREENCRLVDAPCCWPGGSFGVCRYKLLVAVDARRYPSAENWVWSDQEDQEDRGSNDHAASTCGPHNDSFNDTNKRRRSNCSTNNFRTPCRSKS